MKTKRKQGWLNWWWVESTMPGCPSYVKTTWTTRRQTAKELQAYDVGNECRVGRVYRMRASVEDFK